MALADLCAMPVSDDLRLIAPCDRTITPVDRRIDHDMRDGATPVRP